MKLTASGRRAASRSSEIEKAIYRVGQIKRRHLSLASFYLAHLVDPSLSRRCLPFIEPSVKNRHCTSLKVLLNKQPLFDKRVPRNDYPAVLSSENSRLAVLKFVRKMVNFGFCIKFFVFVSALHMYYNRILTINRR